MTKPLKLLAAVIIMLMAGCKQEPAAKEFTVNGEIKNLPDGKVYLQQIYFSDRTPEILDSVDVKAGKFQIGAKAMEEGFYRLNFEQTQNAYVFVNDLEQISFTADAQDLSLEGPKFNTPANTALKNLMKEMDKSRKEYIAAKRSYDSVRLQVNSDSVSADYARRMEMAENGFKDYIFQTINTTKSPVIAMVALGYTKNSDTAELDKAFPRLLEKFPNHAELTALHDRYLQLTKGITPDQSRKGPPSVGDIAPDFTLEDADGGSFSLSSLKGKYVLVDFWASWCTPCRRENPNIVEAFQKYKDKNFTVFGVSLDSDRGAWKAAIKKDNLAWKQVSDLKKWESAVVPMYGIEGIPYNVLLDPSGKIIETDLRGGSLHSKLAEILK